MTEERFVQIFHYKQDILPLEQIKFIFGLYYRARKAYENHPRELVLNKRPVCSRYRIMLLHFVQKKKMSDIARIIDRHPTRVRTLLSREVRALYRFCVKPSFLDERFYK